QELTVVFAPGGATPAKVDLRPGPLRLVLENRSPHTAMAGVFLPSAKFHHLLERRTFLTGKRLLSNQTFRDLFRGETLEMNQRLKIASLTVLFTDLKGSTALYDKVGDLVAYDLVREHFRVLTEVVRGEGGAVVKTIGDAVMATFPTPQQGLSAALRMRPAMKKLNEERGHDPESLELKIGLHEGPCLAVTLNERLDYFGQAVNIAARVQALADSNAIFATQPVRDAGLPLLGGREVRQRRAQLKGVSDEMTVYEIV
ncbi:MAG: adenylate/guanylate cyclase domain-containing protein, partial [Myxococcales bacterium]